MSTDQQEMPVMAKELVDYFKAQGIEIHYAYAREIIKACPHAIRQRYVLPSRAWSWWVLTPEFKPFSERIPQPGDTRPLAEAMPGPGNS